MRWVIIVGDRDAESSRNYAAWLNAGGVEPDFLLPGQPLPDRMDALLLIGGGDVDPRQYGRARRPETGPANLPLDAAEITAVRRALEQGRPVLGICRGLQVAWVALGGRLIQHVPDNVDPVREEHRPSAPGVDARHGLKPDPATAIGRHLSGVRETNSAHHQAADPETRPGLLRVAAWSPGGIIEAAETVDGPWVSLVQWHPERLPPGHPAGTGLRDYWVRAAARRAQ